jgi:hypothetical protein
MAFTPVTGNAMDIKKSSEAHVGTYVGKEEITTKIGPQVIWNFVDEDGQPFGVYGFTNLNRCMLTLPIGSFCRLTYQGTKKCTTKYGLKDVHQVLVEVDSDKFQGKEEQAKREDVPF